MRFRFQLLLVLAGFPVARAPAQTRAETIRGQVKTDSGKVLIGADIIVTMAPNREIFRTSSDSAGRYALTIEKGTGDYLVYIGSAGRRPFRKRILRGGSDSVFVVDAALAKEVTAIAAVRTTAQRTRPRRDDDAPGQVGALSTQFAGVVGALTPDQMGDLNAMAALVPGVATTPEGGVSVFGVDPSQNRVTLNGMSFDGGSLPRDLPIRTRVAGTVFDPTIGGFGGALIAAEISPGDILTFGRAHVTLDAPQLQAADATGRSLGQRYSQALLSYGRSGELSQDRWVYSAAIQGSHRSSPAPSLTTADAAALERLGVSGDSAARLLGILGADGVPFRAGNVGADRTTTSVGAAFRLDRSETYSVGISPADTRIRVSISGTGNYYRSGPTLASALAAPSRDARAASGNLWLQTTVSQYFGKNADYLSETKTAVSYSDQRTTPFTVAPGGSVRIASALDDGSQSINSLQFGGGSSATNSSTWRWEASNELSFSPARAPAHRVKIYSQAQIDGYRDAATSTLGMFSYNSLADLEANSPASFSRTLFSPGHAGGEASGAFAIADYWTRSPTLSFVFGPRLEWDAFTRAPLDNPEVERLFGARTSAVPNGVHVSPRFGFNWLYNGRRALGTIVATSLLGSVYPAPKGVLRGGIGEFRGLYSPSLLAPAIAGTGLAGSTATRLICVGDAVPTPNWTAYSSNSSSVPSTCANGTGAASFADAAPAVQLFDQSYTAPRRWTGNVNWSSAWRFVIYSFDAAYSLNLDQPGVVDLNYSGQRQFTLGNEDDRPIFVSPSSIVPATGLVSPLDARVSPAFGRVMSRRSDLRSDVKQGTISILPVPPQRIGQFFLTGSYTYSASRRLASGFDDNTFGDPRVREWSAGLFPEHQVRAQAGYRFKRLNSTFTTSWIFQSGYPYTPLVAGDINGDGAANDRAFVFNPSSAPQSVAAGMRDLLSSTTGEARDCLERQFGTVAERNSCHRPWSTTMNARFSFDHRFGDNYHYITGSINFANPLAGLDQLFHGADHLRGWGLPAAPDPTLYYVRGFDQSTKEFVYEVNPRFGNTRPSISALYNPFRITLDFSFSLNGNIGHEQAEKLLRPTRGAPGVRPPADTILRRLTSGGPTPISPLYWVLANADSLLLSPEQVRAVNGKTAEQRAFVDSTYKVLAEELARVPLKYDIEAVAQRVRKASDDVFRESPRIAGQALRSILTPIQLRLLPPDFMRMFNLGPASP